MDKFRGIFQMLYLLAKSDHEVVESEIDVMNDYIHANHGSIDFDPGQEIQKLEVRNKQQQLDTFCETVTLLKSLTSDKEKRAILKFCSSVILADNIIHRMEQAYSDELLRIWDLSGSDYLSAQ